MPSLYNEPDLGYVFHPLSHPGDPGHPRLDIFFRQQRSERHFDVSEVHLSVFTAIDLVDRISVSLHHLGPLEGRLCPGRIIMESFKSKTVEAFTFGGQFLVEIRPELTLCTIRSKVPILEIIQEETISSRLTQEVEILLAGRRAAWGQDPDQLTRRLSRLDEITLYHACLEELHNKFRLLPHLGYSFSSTFNQFLIAECHGFQNKYGQGELSQTFEEFL